ncbi:MAG: phosphoadenylyl-sulfate reductase [Chitinophagaceae bacterium]|nr:phosphoadenylyl-sulfate reductase [Chitinophagaceae bacterium]
MTQNSIHTELQEIEKNLASLKTEDQLRWLANYAPGAVTLSTSFSEEDQILTHQIFEQGLDIAVFTLDTGRLFPETYSTWSATLERYQKPITAYYPNDAALQNFVGSNGPNAFYDSVALRQQCCQIRKVEPLKRALAGKKIWITGIRAAHSPNRTDMHWIEWDEGNQLIKVHPLFNWAQEQVKSYINSNVIPYNPLHDRGFVSIGCAPCTRAIKPGEDFRAGRWWWEDASKKECGLHVHASVSNA